MGAVIATGLIAFISMFVPGVLLALALLYKKTDFHIFEIVVIGFIFGLVAPASLTWVELFLISYSPIFTFSLGLFEANALILTIIGIILCFWQGVFKDFSLSSLTRKQYIKKEVSEINTLERDYTKRLEEVREKLSSFAPAKELIEAHRREEEDAEKKAP